MTEAATSSDKGVRRRRRWLRRLFIALFVLAVVVVVLDGPGGRWIVRSVVESQLEKQGLRGDFELSGRLHSGYSLRNASLTGSGVIRELGWKEITVDYRLRKLVDGQIDGLLARDLKVVLQTGAKSEPEEVDAPAEIEVPAEMLRKIRGWVVPVALDVEGVAVEIQRDGKEALTIDCAGIRHRAGEDGFQLSGLASNVLGERGLPRQDLDLAWEAERITASQVVVFPKLVVDDLSLDFPAGQPAKLSAEAGVAGSVVGLEADGLGAAKLTLGDVALDLGELAAELPGDLDLTGTVEVLVLELDGLLSRHEDWRGRLQLQGSGLQSGRFALQGVEATGTVTETGIELLASLGKEQDANIVVRSRLPKRFGGPLMAGNEVTFEMECRDLAQLLPRIVKSFATGAEDPMVELPGGTGRLAGNLVWDDGGKLSSAEATWRAGDLVYDGKPVPPLKGSCSLAGPEVDLSISLEEPSDGESVRITAKANLDVGTYDGSAAVRLPDPGWVNVFLPPEAARWRPAGPVAVDWQGSGAYKEKKHKGSLEVTEFGVAFPDEAQSTVAGTVRYDWPGLVEVDPLLIRSGELRVGGGLAWGKGMLQFRKLEASDTVGALLTLDGSLPLGESVRSVADVLDQTGKCELKIDSADLTLARLEPFLPFEVPKGYAGEVETHLRLSGTPAKPALDGHLQVLRARVPEPKVLPPSTTRIELATTDGVLTARGSVTEPSGDVLTLSAELPLKVREWAREPASFGEATFQCDAVSETIDFPRLAAFIPQLTGIEGRLDVNFSAAGPVSKPKLSGHATVAVDRLPLPDTPYRMVENSKLLFRFDGHRLYLDPSPITIEGGKIILAGDADIAGDEPRFNVTLTTDHALLWRDDAYSARANSKLMLAGTPRQAKLSGTIDIVETLYYKDIEIIPIGLPRTTVSKPKLPKIDQPGKKAELPLPAPFADWLLDVKVRTADPILIRGNLATGSVLVDAALGGRLGAPQPSGRIEFRDIKALLPFSTLEIERGSLVLRPEAPLDPVLDIRGTSSVNLIDVEMQVLGPLSNPRYALSSNPPLLENDILGLLATGVPISDLENTDTASMKAFQLLIGELRNRTTAPDGNAFFKTVLKELDNVELRVGEEDVYSGHKFSTATLKLTDHYYLSAGFDADGKAAAVVIYSLRLR